MNKIIYNYEMSLHLIIASHRISRFFTLVPPLAGLKKCEANFSKK